MVGEALRRRECWWCEGLITPASLDTIRRHLSGCNSVKSGGPISIFEPNPQQFHNWNRMESLV